MENLSLRETFNSEALLYDKFRPGYPKECLDDLITLATLPTDGTILEIGCGTGQATAPLAARGYYIDCIELGERLAELARQNLKAYDRVTVHTGAFEEFPLEAGQYDLVLSATAFHWIDPKVAYIKAAKLLKSNGALGLIWNVHVHSRESEAFFEDVAELYRLNLPSWTVYYQGLPRPDVIEDRSEGIGRSGLFEPVVSRRYQWNAVYDSASYINLLSTYSDHIALPDHERSALLKDTAALIDGKYGGQITKTYLTVLYVAKLL